MSRPASSDRDGRWGAQQVWRPAGGAQQNAKVASIESRDRDRAALRPQAYQGANVPHVTATAERPPHAARTSRRPPPTDQPMDGLNTRTGPPRTRSRKGAMHDK